MSYWILKIDNNGVVIGNESIPDPHYVVTSERNEASCLKVQRDPYHLLVQERRHLWAVGC